MKNIRFALAGVAVFSGALLLSSCSSSSPDDDGGNGDNTPTAQGSGAPISTPTPEESTTTPASSADITAAGTVLGIGDSAVIEYHTYSYPDDPSTPVLSADSQLIRLTVTSIEDATLADLPDNADVSGEPADELSVAVVRYEVKTAGPPIIDMTNRTIISDRLTLGDPDSFMFFDRNGASGCMDPVFFGAGFNQGQTVEGCFTVVYYTANGMPDIEYSALLTDTEGAPIVWR
jgi:hypothetical protein